MVFAGGLLTLFGSLSNVQQPGQSRAENLAQSFPPPMASLFPPRPRFPLPPPRHLLPLLLLAPHPQAVPRDGLPPAGAGRRRRRVGGPGLPEASYCSLAPWRLATQV